MLIALLKSSAFLSSRRAVHKYEKEVGTFTNPEGKKGNSAPRRVPFPPPFSFTFWLSVPSAKGRRVGDYLREDL